MTLKALLQDQIKTKGCISVEHYIEQCLYHPAYGYYMQQPAIGRGADFITAPALTNLFGQALAVWVVQTWEKLGCPPKWCLAEGGAGHGTLMLDICMALQSMQPALLPCTKLAILEISPYMRAIQKETLRGYDVHWCENTAQLPQDLPVVFFANELLDAFPVQQFCGSDERRIILENNAFAFDKNEDITEYPAQMLRFLESLRTKIAAALFIDYGHFAEESHDTLQAVHKHQKVSIFHKPGHTDITAHVPFRQAAMAFPAAEKNLSHQADFLLKHGLAVLAEQSLRKAAPAEKESIENAVKRLLHPAEMGHTFKALEIFM